MLGALAIRVVVEGRGALAQGDAWLLRGRPAEAIRAYETAARWYLPLAPHVSYAKLRALTEPTHDATQGPVRPANPSLDAAHAAVQLAAWRATRSAALATRSLWQPYPEELEAANAAIAKISAGVPQAGTVDPAWHRERLARPTRPRAGTVALASLGILLWLGGAIVGVRRGIGPTGALAPRIAGSAGIAIILGLGLWAAGLYNA